MIRNQKGITIIALIVTIVVLLILAGITIQGAIRGVDDAQEDKLWSEISVVQHAVVERDTKYKLTKDKDLLVGNPTEDVELPDGKSFKLTSDDIGDDVEKKYYELNEEALSNLGLEPGTGNSSQYIVNYYTGEVYNKTFQKTPKSNTLLYITLKLDKNE